MKFVCSIEFEKYTTKLFGENLNDVTIMKKKYHYVDYVTVTLIFHPRSPISIGSKPL